MATSMLSQDIVGICLVLAKGDIDMDLEQIMAEADRFQEANDRHFGLTRQDFRGLFRSLFAWNLGSSHPLALSLEGRGPHGRFEGIPSGEIIPLILPFQDAYFNDEGEYWNHIDIATREQYRSYGCECWYGYSWEEYCRRVQVKQAMRELLIKRESQQPQSVVRFMKLHEIDDGLLFHCSRPGEST